MQAEDGGPRIERVEVSAFTIPTSSPESDGTLEWGQTTIVIVTANAAGARGIGYSYADIATAHLADSTLKHVIQGRGAMDVKGCWAAMVQKIRNLGRPGISSMAIAAVDSALWDLKARLLGCALADLLGRSRGEVPVYGSGGFTSYSNAELEAQFAGWVEQGIGAVKMKVGRDPAADPERVAAARRAAGDRTRLMIDANGAYSRKQALRMALVFRESGVEWFEEPVSSDDLDGLRLMRNRAPAGMEIAAGEYGYDPVYFRRMLAHGSVDVLQADATRCAGVTGFMLVDGLCQGFGIPLSAHTSPTLHGHLCCASLSARDVEYFHDHVRIEQMVFDGALTAIGGALRPDRARPGMGLEIKHPDIERYRVYG